MDDHINSDYETDALIWTNTQIALLRAGKFDQLDLDNVISELEYQVRKDKREVAHRLIGLMTHLLKYKYQPERISASWIRTINGHRLEIAGILTQMPSLRPSLDAYVAKGYAKAVKDAAKETHLPLSTFPKENPFTVDQILDEDFWPGQK
ncbi:DUF29 domain-containing protein [Duganella aceris]|uniref:DUF29 domain-containing protein n=1 Tax=Duganella aceris TaxID=2703883 RepID=A0ABX0FIP0_9BURK|nr:DUF29 domain-containing protein [Duganella aceris]NGZ84422.1 DUF29 domain-containing protein [Duganella aceris]